MFLVRQGGDILYFMLHVIRGQCLIISLVGKQSSISCWRQWVMDCSSVKKWWCLTQIGTDNEGWQDIWEKVSNMRERKKQLRGKRRQRSMQEAKENFPQMLNRLRNKISHPWSNMAIKKNLETKKALLETYTEIQHKVGRQSRSKNLLKGRTKR